MTRLINENQVVGNRLTGPEGQISKVCLTGYTKKKKKARNRLTSRIPAPRKRYRMSYFSVQWCRAWLIDVRETVEIIYFRQTKIILWWSHVVVSVLWINQVKWTQSTVHCISILRLNVFKNTHGVYMMYTTKPSFSRKLRLEKTNSPYYQRKWKFSLKKLVWMCQIITSQVFCMMF